APHRADQIIVAWWRTRFSGSNLVLPGREVARTRTQVGSRWPVAPAAGTVAFDAVCVVHRFPARLRASADACQPRQAADERCLEEEDARVSTYARCQIHEAHGASTILPSAPGSITISWARGASASGISRLTTGLSVPLSRPEISAAWISAKS